MLISNKLILLVTACIFFLCQSTDVGSHELILFIIEYVLNNIQCMHTLKIMNHRVNYKNHIHSGMLIHRIIREKLNC